MIGPTFKIFQNPPKMQMFSVQWPGDDANVFEQLLMINRRCRQAGTKKRNMIKEENFQANEVRAERTAAGCWPHNNVCAIPLRTLYSPL